MSQLTLYRSTRDVAFPFTTTPGSIVNVTPEATVTFPVITNGLSATAQVVFDEIVPDTFVGPTLHAAPGNAPTTSATTTSSERTYGHAAPLDPSSV